MQGLVHTVLIKIIKAYTFPFVTGRGKTTTHSSTKQGRWQGGGEEAPALGSTSPSLPTSS